MDTKSAGILGGCIIVAALILTLVPRPSTGPAVVAPKQDVPAAAPDRQHLEMQRAALGQAFSRNDPQAWAAIYAPDAEFVEETGEVLQGPAAIQKSLAKLFADNKGIQAQAFRTNERFITPDVVLEDGTFRVWGLKGGGQSEGRYVTVWAHRNGQWLLVSHRNWIPTKQPEP